MKKLIHTILSLFILAMVLAQLASAVEVSTFHYPPLLSKTKIGNLGNGLYVEITRRAFKNADIPVDIKFFPLKRSLVNLGNGKSDFSVTARALLAVGGLKEKDLGLINLGFFHVNLYYLKSRYPNKITYKSLSDLKQYKVGIIRGSFLSSPLRKAGIKVQEVNSPETNLKKLMKNRIGLWAAVDITSNYVISNLFPDRKDEMVAVEPTLSSGEVVLSYLKSNQSARKIAGKLIISLNKMKQDGSYLKLMKGYWGASMPKNVLPQDMQ